MQTGKITKSKSNDRFTIIPNEPLQRDDLSWKAKGLLCYLLSLPQDWELYKTELQNHSTDGRDSTSAGFDELYNAGYIEVEEVRLRGKFKGYNYTVHNSPKTDFPKSVKPKTVKPKTENPQLQKKHSTKETFNKENIYFILSETTKIFQPALEIRHQYEKENYIMFRDIAGGISSRILVPETFIIQYCSMFEPTKYEGLLRNFFSDFSPEKREEEFMKIARKVFASYHGNLLEDFNHFLNITKKIQRDFSNGNKKGVFFSRGNKDFDITNGTAGHGEGWS